MPALAELEAAWLEARDDPGFRAELARLLRDYGGRPTPLYHAERLSEAAGRPVWLKREDLIHTGAHKLNNALGQACSPSAWASRASSPRPARASTASPPRRRARCSAWSASSTWAPRTSAASSPTSSAWGCSAPTRRAASTPGARTLKEAVSAAIRDWVANVGDTHYVIGSCVGPAPFPALVRDLQRVIGDEARAQILERERAAARARGRVRRRRLERDRHLHPVRRRRRGRARRRRGRRARGSTRGRHGAPLTVGGRGGVLHGSYSAIMQDEEGQILEAHSISAGLDYPGPGPSTRGCATPAARATWR